MSRLIDCDSEEETTFEECPSCEGAGCYDIGDCEDGVTETCPECDGKGEIELGDVFVPKRDAWTKND